MSMSEEKIAYEVVSEFPYLVEAYGVTLPSSLQKDATEDAEPPESEADYPQEQSVADPEGTLPQDLEPAKDEAEDGDPDE